MFKVRSAKAVWCCLLAVGLGACGNRVLRFDLVPVEEQLSPQVIEQDEGVFVTDKIAMIDLSGLISNAKSKSLLSEGHNKVSDLRETLNAIERDPSVKAVVLRINSPGGTITATEMMYRDLLEFKKRTHKPVVTVMLDVCASGGFYVSCASDYRIAYPSTITGSIGVIIQTVNFSGTMSKLGISAKAFTSGPNKDMLSPLRPLSESDSALAQNMVNEFYGQFLHVVKTAHPNVKEADWPMLTDGRVVTGKDAVKYGLVDQTGDIDAALAKAKEMAGIKKAQIIQYTRHDEHKGSVYAAGEPVSPQVNLMNFNIDLSELTPALHPQFLYLWAGQ